MCDAILVPLGLRVYVCSYACMRSCFWCVRVCACVGVFGVYVDLCECFFACFGHARCDTIFAPLRLRMQTRGGKGLLPRSCCAPPEVRNSHSEVLCTILCVWGSHRVF